MLKNITNSHDKISDFMREIRAPSFSSAEVQKIADSFADKLEVERQALLEEIRKAIGCYRDKKGKR